MRLDPYLQDVAGDLTRATALADDGTRDVASALASVVEPALRLALVHALSDAAAQISSQLDSATVLVRMEGRDPVLHVQHLSAAAETTVAQDEGGEPARVTVRLPEELKGRAETLAAQADQSLNTWIVQTIRRAVTPRPEPTTSRSRRVTGWA